MEKLDFQKLKESLTTEQVITLIESLGGFVSETQNTSEYLIFSSFLYHVGDSNQHSYKLYYYYDNHSFHDYKLGESYDIYSLIQYAKELYEAKDYSVVDAYNYICSTLGIDKEVIKTSTKSYSYSSHLSKYLSVAKKKHIDTNDIVYDPSILDMFPRQYHQSWIDDNISVETMRKFNIRYCPWDNKIIIPCDDINNNLIGIRCRNVDERRNWKYLPLTMLDGTSFAFQTSNHLYGINHNAENIKRLHKAIVLESEKGVLQADTYVKAGENICVGLYGSAFTKQKLNILLSLGVTEIVIGYDFDYEVVGGEGNEMWNNFVKKVEKTAEIIRPYCKVTAMVDYDKHKIKSSPTDMGRNKFFRLYKDREEL